MAAFEVWQNVPFFLTLKELDLRFGYLLESESICLHDERYHQDTLSTRRPDWNAQVVKSIILLFYRNELWEERQQSLNRRFIETMAEVLAAHVVIRAEDALRSLLQIAQCLRLTPGQCRTELRRMAQVTPDARIREAIDLLIQTKWSDLQPVRSAKLTQPM